jgi:ABC-2 type transport system permease protein
MLRGLWRLTWLEIKIFAREPLGLFGALVPALIFLVIGRSLGPQIRSAGPNIPRILSADLPVLAALLSAISAVLSLVAVISIYREGGILKRLRATPLRPYTILTAQVLVKLLFTIITMAIVVIAGRRYYPLTPGVPVVSFAAALLFGTVSILSLGFLIASVVPTARFSQPIGTLVLYPMLGISGIFVPVTALPPALQVIARMLPLTYAVSLLRGIWAGEGWFAHGGDVAALAVMFLAFTMLSAKMFRWE